MMRQLAFFALLLVYGLAYPIGIEKYEDIPEQYREMIPENVATQLKSITPEERKVLTEMVKDYAKYKNEDEFLEALKGKSQTMYEKAKEVHEMIKSRVDALEDEAKEFVKKLIEEARKVYAELLAGMKPSLEELKTSARKHIDEYEKLSDSAKEDLKKQFPIFVTVFSNEKAKEMVEKYVKN